MSDLSPKNKIFRELIAGSGAGMMGLLMGYPLDTVKVIQQTTGKTIAKSLKHIYKTQGIKGFFRGMTVPLITNGVVFAAFFASYQASLEYYVTHNPEESDRLKKYPALGLDIVASYPEIFYAGCVGGLFQSLVAGPVELIKVQMQVDGSKKSNINLIKKIYRARGLMGFSQGMGATLLRDVHSHGVYTVAYRKYLDFASGNTKNMEIESEHEDVISLMTAGAFAGVLFWWSCIPFDVIKSRMQGQPFANRKYKTSLDCAIAIYKEGGIKSFGRGFYATTIRAIPSNACIFLTYVKIRHVYDWAYE